MPDDGTHKCPKDGCEVRVPRVILACTRHWFALKPETRRLVNEAWHHGTHADYQAARELAVNEMNGR